MATGQADSGIIKRLEKLQEMVEKLQRSTETNHSGTSLIQCAREVIVKGVTMYEASLAAESVAGGQGVANRNICVAKWVNTLGSIGWDKQCSNSSDVVSNVSSVFSEGEAQTVVTSPISAQRVVQEREGGDIGEDDSDDDLDADLAQAALDTGTKAFEAQEWEEADSLLQEALRILQQLPKPQRVFCDIFTLHYKLAVCAFHTQEPVFAEEALTSLVLQSASSNQQRECICDASHLLSHLYVRMGQIDRARSECEKALQARRRLLGKWSDASLESTALMAHIYVLLNNRARAISCLAMIPEARRDTILKTVEKSLGTKVERPDSSSIVIRSSSEDLDLAGKPVQSRLPTASPKLPMDNHVQGSLSTTISKSPNSNFQKSHQRIPSNQSDLELVQSVTETSFSPAKKSYEPKATDREKAVSDCCTYPEGLCVAAMNSGESSEADHTFKRNKLSRKEIIDRIGCQPRDKIEEAVCDGDYLVFANLLNGKNDFWRSKLRKRVRPERVTALHFAALFGEIDMARCLLSSSFNINEVPYGYTTNLTPLKFAVGARQVDMVGFLIDNGAKPSAPDSWSTLAGQLMNRSWLKKTMSETEKEHVPNLIIAILKILLQHGWDVNAPFETSGGTVLHQAVGFWTGSYTWDLNLRTVVTSFLCGQGADPFQQNNEGKTPYDIASASGHQDLLIVLDRG